MEEQDIVSTAVGELCKIFMRDKCEFCQKKGAAYFDGEVAVVREERTEKKYKVCTDCFLIIYMDNIHYLRLKDKALDLLIKEKSN